MRITTLFLLTIALAVGGCGKKDKDKNKDGDKTTKPATDKAKPATDKAKPATDKAKPATDKAKPAADMPKPKVENKDGVITVTEAGLATPESVLWDRDEDVYLVSNINGKPTEADGNGFISKFAPDGLLVAHKWIDGAKDGVTLNAPKGMALTKDTLWVADVTHVRMFDRKTGAPKGEIELPGATFANDVVAHGEKVWVSDSGLKADFSPSGTAAIWAIENGAATAIKDEKFGQPNGLVVTEDGTLYVNTWDNSKIWSIDAKGKAKTAIEVGKKQLDGLALINDSVFLVTSWEAKTLFAGSDDGPFEIIADNLESPADIAYDEKRMRAIVPLFTKDTLVFQPVKGL